MEASIELSTATGPGAVGTAEVSAGLEDASAEVGDEPAEETHSHTALAEARAARPVSAPQPLRTQLRAAALMAAVFSHWQAKSVSSLQPTPWAASAIHSV